MGLVDPNFTSEIPQIEDFSDLPDLRNRCAESLGASPYLTSFVPNFSLAYERFLQVVSSRRILAFEDDYPSLIYPLRSLKNVRLINLDRNDLDAIRTAMVTYQPDFFCFSLTHHISGHRFRESDLHALKNALPSTQFLADCTQHVGIGRLSNTRSYGFDQSALDVIIASGYKWLNAGTGTGFLAMQDHVAQEYFSHMDLLTESATACNDRGSLLGYFEPGHLNMPAVRRLTNALEQFCRIDQSVIVDQIAELKETLFNHIGFFKTSSQLNSDPPYIFHQVADRSDFEALLAKGIKVSWRADGVRMGLHYLNTTDEVRKFAEILNGLA
jgi:selenocysteine lyase/cysteine desulfurase